MGLIRANADWVGLLKVIREERPGDDDGWGRDVARFTGKLIGLEGHAGIAAVEHDAGLTEASTVLNAFSENIARVFDISAANLLGRVGRETYRQYFHPKRIATTHTEIERGLPPEASAPARTLRTSVGYGDMVGMLAYPEPGTVVVLAAATREPTTLTLADRQSLTRVALHLQAAYRLRKRPESVVAELDSKGRLLHREAGAPESSALSEHVVRAQRAQSRDGAVDLWPALVEGRYSLVQRGNRYLVLENAPEAQPMRALSARQAEVIAQAARGLSAKMVGYALGISVSSVAHQLLDAAAKVGVASRLELVRVAAMLSRDPRAGFAEIALTAAERDVLDLLQLGLSNEEIAKMRSRSVRTIANQVASLLRKTGRGSRRGLFR